MRKVLYVSHNHLSIRPGGLEAYADELYRAVGAAGEFDALFVTKVGPPHSTDTKPEGTRFALRSEDPVVYSIHTRAAEFDRTFWSCRNKQLYTEDWRGFLRLHEPDIVHFHHANWLGYDIIRETRRTLPDGAIVYTLHDFGPICHHNGQMVRTESLAPCDHASPQRCHQCFPEIAAERFFLRERFIKSAFELVDMFIAPSDHARRRYIEWGIPPERIKHEDYGRVPVSAAPDPPEVGHRNRLGFFGQMTPYKGVDVLLEAMKILARQGFEARLVLRGANLEFQQLAFQERIQALVAETADSVRFPGRYELSELPGLMAAVDWVVVPSIWWETGPLVIHEAQMHRRPVICSDIGSMPERIKDGVNGLLFRVGDPDSLADTIRRALTTPGLWDQLRSNITDPYPMDRHLKVISSMYRKLLKRRERLRAA